VWKLQLHENSLSVVIHVVELLQARRESHQSQHAGGRKFKIRSVLKTWCACAWLPVSSTDTWGAHTIWFDDVNVAVSKHVCILLGSCDVSAKTASQGVCDGSYDVQFRIEPMTRLLVVFTVGVLCTALWVTNGYTGKKLLLHGSVAHDSSSPSRHV